MTEQSIPVRRLISAAGFTTALGGGSLPEAVRHAMDEAAASTYRLAMEGRAAQAAPGRLRS